MIFAKALKDLDDNELQNIKDLILSCFSISRLLLYDTVVYYVIKNMIIGFIGLHTKQYCDKVYGDITILNQVCVKESYRNQGIATALLRHVDEHGTLILYIDKDQEDTETLYQFYKLRGFNNFEDLDKDLITRTPVTYHKQLEYLMIKPGCK